jgi:hypothetical protein
MSTELKTILSLFFLPPGYYGNKNLFVITTLLIVYTDI